MTRRLVDSGSRRRRRGWSFVELLIAMAVMAIMMIGVLQLFALSLAVNKGSHARTHMTFKCQQVVENIRYYWNLVRTTSTLPSEGGMEASYQTEGTYNLPYLGTEPEYAYWGPLGADVIEGANGPFRISYTIGHTSAGPGALWLITVTAVPTDVASATRYFGVGLRSGRRIDYVAQFQ